MRIRKLASRLLVAGVLGASMVAAPVMLASPASAVECVGGGGGGFVPTWGGGGGGGGCTTVTPAGNTIQCGSGSGFTGGLIGGGGGCHVFGGPAGDFYCDVSVQAVLVYLYHVNPCPFIP